MDQLYAPWRHKHLAQKNESQVTDECPFCSKFKENIENDIKNLIIKRYETCAVMLNIKPYGMGHVMVIPYDHVKSLSDLTPDQRQNLMEVVTESMSILEDHLQADGMNMGLNKGKVSGGSIDNHLHIHIVSRFIGDSGFLVTCADTKILSFDMKKMCIDLQAAFHNNLSKKSNDTI